MFCVVVQHAKEEWPLDKKCSTHVDRLLFGLQILEHHMATAHLYCVQYQLVDGPKKRGVSLYEAGWVRRQSTLSEQHIPSACKLQRAILQSILLSGTDKFSATIRCRLSSSYPYNAACGNCLDQEHPRCIKIKSYRFYVGKEYRNLLCRIRKNQMYSSAYE